MFLRAVSESFLPSFDRDHVPSDLPAITIPPRQLMALTLRHMHPLQCAYLRDSPQFPFHPEYVFWPVPGEGLLMRSLATTVLVFHAAEYPLNPHFSLAEVKNPDEVAFVTDSDEMAAISLTPLVKDRDWYFEEQRADLDEIGAWWIRFDGPAHQALSRQQFRFHAGPSSEAAWRAVERQADFFVTQALIAREMIRLGRELRRLGCFQAADLLATALYAGRLRRRWRWRGPVTVFAPTDAAFRKSPPDLCRDLVSPGTERRLIDFIQGHVVAGDATSASLVTVGGGRIVREDGADGLRVNGARVVGRHEVAHGHVIYCLDDVFARAAAVAA
jgi:hypothetical protein